MSKNNSLLKVCKVDSITFASYAIKQKVDFLGVHVLTEDNIGEHKELVDFIQAKHSKLIIVTKIDHIIGLKKIVSYYNPSGIQLHFDLQPQLAEEIKSTYPKLILFGVITNHSKFTQFESITKIYDYLIYDYSNLGGTNKKTDYKLFKFFPEELKQKTLLAGGLTAKRIYKLKALQARGYDMQTYFRNDSGINFKNLDKVCDILKFPRKNQLSISLTDLPLSEIHKVSKYYLNSNIEYHLDNSNGSIYSIFNTRNNSIVEKQKFLAQLPFSMHLFNKNMGEIYTELTALYQKFPLNLIRVFIQYFEGIDLKIFTNNMHNFKIIPSVYYKDISSFVSKPVKFEIISIVVPSPDNKRNIDNFIKDFRSVQDYFDDKEIWFDRNLDLNYIKTLNAKLHNSFNYIVGKDVISKWSKINEIHEYLFRSK